MAYSGLAEGARYGMGTNNGDGTSRKSPSGVQGQSLGWEPGTKSLKMLKLDVLWNLTTDSRAERDSRAIHPRGKREIAYNALRRSLPVRVHLRWTALEEY